MSARTGSSDRHVIPRWRSVPLTIAAGEIQVTDPRLLTDREIDELSRFERVWLEEDSDLAAAEFVAACLVAGEPTRAIDASQRLQRQNYRPYRALAEALDRVLAPHDPRMVEPPLLHPAAGIEVFYGRIQEAKRRVRESPRSPIAWCELARRYTALGQFEKAREAISVALALAPFSRYILRSAARSFVQSGEPDVAHQLVVSSPRTASDPWLLASAMSTAALSGDAPPSRSRVRRVLESGKFSSIEQAELSSEFATLELNGGATRRAKSLFESSLSEPTDNSLAQAQWATTKLKSLEIEPSKFLLPFSAEARMRSAVSAGRWDDAIAHAAEWIVDQPFDVEATTMASYAASVGLRDFALAREFTELGLRANPHADTLRNNLAYSLIELGELDEAQLILDSVVDAPAERSDRVAIVATEGLLFFRAGTPDRGRAFYERAIDYAHRHNEREAEAMARAMVLQEEVRLGALERAVDQVRELERLGSAIEDAGVRLTVDRALHSFRTSELSPGLNQ